MIVIGFVLRHRLTARASDDDVAAAALTHFDRGPKKFGAHSGLGQFDLDGCSGRQGVASRDIRAENNFDAVLRCSRFQRLQITAGPTERPAWFGSAVDLFDPEAAFERSHCEIAE